MSNLEVTRNELKYFISNTECNVLVGKLEHVLAPDSHSEPRKGYFIRSLYFDSHDDECLYAKQAGLMYRQKFRMRIYDTSSDWAKFEIKNKHGNQIFKETAKISRSSAYRIIDGDYDELLKYDNPVLSRIYRKFSEKTYRPKVIIDYTRDAFVYDFFNTRITIDKDLKSNTSDFDLFSDNLHTIPVILEGKQVLEIKYENVLPEYLWRLLQLKSFERYAISKYVLGRRFFKLGKWEDN